MSTLGYDIVAVTGKPDNHESLIALGAKNILDRNTIKSDGLPLEKGQWGGAIDSVGGDILAWLTRTINPGGNIASVGLAGGSHFNTTVMPFILRGVSVLGINAPACSMPMRKYLWKRLVNDLTPKHINKIVTNVVQLEDLPFVFENMLAGKTKGKSSN
jgi:NADPH2:quinone reductase